MTADSTQGSRPDSTLEQLFETIQCSMQETIGFSFLISSPVSCMVSSMELKPQSSCRAGIVRSLFGREHTHTARGAFAALAPLLLRPRSAVLQRPAPGLPLPLPRRRVAEANVFPPSPFQRTAVPWHQHIHTGFHGF